MDFSLLAEAQVLEKSPSTILTNSLSGILKDAIAHLPNLAAGAAILAVTWLVAFIYQKFFCKLTSRGNMRKSLEELLVTLGKVAVWLIGTMIAAMILFPGLTPSKALGAAGLASVAIGLAFKDIFQNFFAGILLLWKFPFEPGDFIEWGEVKGKVVDTHLRLTTIRQTNGELIVVPNAFLIGNPVNVLTSRDLRRIEVTTGVAYGEDVEESLGVIRKAVESCALVDKERDRKVLVAAFGASSIDIDILCWADSSPMGQREARSEIVTAVKRALDDAGIEIPFPYRTLTFKEPLHLQSGTTSAGD